MLSTSKKLMLFADSDGDGDGDGVVADTERLCQNVSFTRVVPTRAACQSQLTHRQPNLHGHSQHEPLV